MLLIKVLKQQSVATEINIQTNWNSDEVAEWLRRWTANPLGSTHVGSNPIFVEMKYFCLKLRMSLWTSEKQHCGNMYKGPSQYG